MEVQDLSSLRVAAVRHVGPYPGLGPSFEKVCGWAGQNSLFGPGTRVIGVFHDDPQSTAAAELRSDACITVGDSVQSDADAGIEVTEIVGGRYAVGILKGPYEGLQAAYTWIYSEWLPNSGHTEAHAPSYEVYLNDAASTPPAELLTAIHVPLKK